MRFHEVAVFVADSALRVERVHASLIGVTGIWRAGLQRFRIHGGLIQGRTPGRPSTRYRLGRADLGPQ